ncbi:MAG: hypothetical protein ACE5IC_07840 [Candidatus Brocadiales bacterium]
MLSDTSMIVAMIIASLGLLGLGYMRIIRRRRAEKRKRPGEKKSGLIG